MRTRAIVLLLFAAAVTPLLLLGSLGCGSGGEGVAIYLLADETKPSDLPALSHLEIGEPLVTAQDLLSYSPDTRDFEISKKAYNTIMGLEVPTDGRAFAVCVNRSPVYAAAVWTPVSSQSYDGVVLIREFSMQEVGDRHWMSLDLGYPDTSFFTGNDPRNDPRLLDALENEGKLE